MSETAIIVQWVVDPYDEETRDSRTMINTLINTRHPEEFELLEKDELENGLMLYKYLISNPSTATSYGTILQLLTGATLKPIVFSLDDEHLDHDEIKHLIAREIKNHLGIKVERVAVVRYQDRVDFLPYNGKHQRVYCDSDTLADINQDVLKDCVSCKRVHPEMSGEEQLNEKFAREYMNHKVLVLPTREYGQICELWELGCSKRESGELVVVSETNEFANQEFINNAAHYMRQGEIPRITFYGPWQMWPLAQAPIIEYAAMRAYLEDDHGMGHVIRVEPNMAVTVPIMDAIQYRNFKSNFYRHLNKVNKYHVIQCDDIVDALVKRYQLCLKYGDCKSLVVSMNGLHQMNYRLVTKIGDPKFDDETYSRELLAADLRKHFLLCKHFVAEEKLAAMDLGKLIQIAHVHISSESNQMVCFDEKALSIFPEIRHIGRFGSITSRLSGCYDFGPVRGILRRMPDRSNKTKPELEVEYFSEDIQGYTIEATLISFRGEPIMVSPDLDLVRLEKIVQKGWKQGWFFNELGMALARRGHSFHSTWLAPINLISEGITLVTDGEIVTDVMETFLGE